MKITLSTIFLFLIISEHSYSQDTITNIQKLPSGISVQYGLGNLGVKDGFISEEKYLGYTTNFYLSWNKYHRKYHKRIEVDYRTGDHIKNNNVLASIHQFSLNSINLYPAGSIHLFSKRASFYIGPSTDIFVHFRQQNIASGGMAMFNAISFASLFSVGFNSEMIYPVSEKFNVVLTNNFSVFSLGLRIFDLTDEEVSPVKFLTAFNGLNVKTNISANYQLYKYVSINMGYQSFVSRITAWDKFYGVSDNLFITLTYHMK